MRAAALLLAALASAGCAERGPALPGVRPPAPALLTAVPAGHTGYDNASLAELFVTLTFETEWGGRRARLLRFEEPVVVGIEGPGAEALRPFLGEYLGWLARQTGIDIRQGAAGRRMHVRLVPGRAFRRLLPSAACVLVPGDLAWARFREDPDGLGGVAMERRDRLEAVTIFIPADAPPAARRRCLLEEIAQGLGPFNDLYGLGPSVFNDDFGHVWPTRLDILMLRVLYDPALETGMGRVEAGRAARAVLDRINPAGRAAPPLPEPEHRAEPAWRRLIAPVYRSDTGRTEKIRAARAALAHAEAALPGTPWHCHSLLTLAIAEGPRDPAGAERHLARAEAVCARAHGAEDPRLAQARLRRAGLALARAEPERALALAEGLEAPLAAHGLDEALAEVYALRARALASLGRAAPAQRSARAAAAWGAYAQGLPRR